MGRHWLWRVTAPQKPEPMCRYDISPHNNDDLISKTSDWLETNKEDLMLERYFQSPFTLQRLRTGPSSPYIDGFAQHLDQEGYSWKACREHLNSACHLGNYLETKKRALDDIVFDTLKEFSDHLSSCQCPNSYRGSGIRAVGGAKKFLKYLKEGGLINGLNYEKPEADLILAFKDWLKCQRGLADSTILNYGKGVTHLLAYLGDNPSKYTVLNLRSFVIDRSKVVSSKNSLHVSGLRMFLRFLIEQGKCPVGLDSAIPVLASWRNASLPSYLPATDVQKIIDTCLSESLIDVRDKAIILLFARLGLRSKDVAHLRFSQIDWADGNIVFSGKGRREERLPLTQEVGDAIVAYLQRRPKVREDRVFLRIPPPHRPFCRDHSVSQIVSRRMHRCGINSSQYGSQILRHTAATQMLREGVTLYDISKVLRHQSIKVTAYYAKVDFDLLKEVTQPWPEVLKC